MVFCDCEGAVSGEVIVLIGPLLCQRQIALAIFAVGGSLLTDLSIVCMRLVQLDAMNLAQATLPVRSLPEEISGCWPHKILR